MRTQEELHESRIRSEKVERRDGSLLDLGVDIRGSLLARHVDRLKTPGGAILDNRLDHRVSVGEVLVKVSIVEPSASTYRSF